MYLCAACSANVTDAEHAAILAYLQAHPELEDGLVSTYGLAHVSGLPAECFDPRRNAVACAECVESVGGTLPR